MQQLDLQQIFDAEIAVPNVNTFKELASVLREVQAFEDENQLVSSLNTLRDITDTDHIGIGIKKVLHAVRLAQQDEGNMIDRFAEVISQRIAASRD